MKTIAIYAPQNAVGMSIMLIMEMCWYAVGKKAQELSETPQNSWVKIVSSAGQDLTCANGVSLPADGDLSHLEQAAAVFVGGFWGEVDDAVVQSRGLFPILRKIACKGTPIGAVSTGTFLLAETGLLDGKVATTYAPFVDAFAQRYPSINLRRQRAITDAGGLYCANGIPAGCDLTISIIEQIYGPDVARQTAKAFLVGFSRSYSLANVVFDGQKYHGDKQILTSQQWLERNFSGAVRIAILAEDVGMSPRNFTRRFKAATNESPHDYLRRVRLEAAKDLMRRGDLSFSEIADQVGYRDPGSLTKAFHKDTGQTPGEFRKSLQMTPKEEKGS
jgi:transcriptional regulator GlxA family with amidase domain